MYTAFIVFSAIIITGVAAACLWRFFASYADLIMSIYVGIMAGALACVAVIIVVASQEQNRLDQAKAKASKDCSPYRAKVFVDKDKMKVVYACADGSPMKVLSYK